MSILKYKKRNVISPRNLRNHIVHRRQMPKKGVVLEDFIGKFQANEQINCVNLKHEFKNQEV